MEASGVLIRVTQFYAWSVFLFSWAQMGWVDWREQKIRNQYIVFWLKMVLLGYALILGQSLLGAFGVIEVFILRGYYLDLLSHAAFSAGAAYALWRLRIWPAGDVKLFVLLALCYPLMRIPGSFRSGMLFLEVMINVFVPAAAFLFLTAGEYLWRTRFAHYKTHAAASVRAYFKGFRLPEFRVPAVRAPAIAMAAPSLPALDFRRFRLPAVDFGGGARAAFSAVRVKAGEAWIPVKREVSSWLQGYRDDPKRFVIDALSWLAMMAIMSMISYYLNDVITSNVLKTLVCFALMFTWSRICQFVGTGWALAVVACVCAAVLWRHPNIDLPALAVVFGNITIFSLCIFLGMQLAFKIIAGKTGFVFLPFVVMLPGLIPWRFLFSTVWSWFAAAWAWILSLSLPRLPAPSLPDLPSLPSVPPLPAVPVPPMPELPAVHLPALGDFAAPAWLVAADFSGFTLWACMGLFFGLALVFVKIWDSESYASVPIAHIDRFMTLGPSLVERIEADDDFRDEHFSTFYADGLTGEQVLALREWCVEEGLETVPLAPTISFANWIFLGYFLTRLLEGHVLRFLY